MKVVVYNFGMMAVKEWLELDEELQRELAYQRAGSHNESLKNIASFYENVQVFSNLVDLCKHKDINIKIIVPPATKYYAEALSKNYMEIMYEVFEKMGMRSNVLDLFTDQRFLDNDFVDTDHLNDSGAIKFSQIILEYLEK